MSPDPVHINPNETNPLWPPLGRPEESILDSLKSHLSMGSGQERVRSLFSMLRTTTPSGLQVASIVPTAMAAEAYPPFMRPVPPTLADGEIFEGMTLFGIPWNKPLDRFGHVLAAGMAGSGKTTCFLNHIGQFARLGVRYVVFDSIEGCREKDYRHVLPYDPNLLVFQVRPSLRHHLRYNPLQLVSNTDPINEVQKKVAIMASSFGMWFASLGALMDCMHELYEKFGIFSSSNNVCYPTLADLLEFIEQNEPKYFSKERDQWSVLHNRLKMINQTIGPVVNVSRGFPLERLLSRFNLIFELDSLLPPVHDYLFLSLLMDLQTILSRQSSERGAES